MTAEYKRLWACIDSSTDASIDEQIKPLKAKEVEMSKIESKFFTRVDVTECFPFLVTKMSPYYDR